MITNYTIMEIQISVLIECRDAFKSYLMNESPDVEADIALFDKIVRNEFIECMDKETGEVFARYETRTSHEVDDLFIIELFVNFLIENEMENKFRFTSSLTVVHGQYDRI